MASYERSGNAVTVFGSGSAALTGALLCGGWALTDTHFVGTLITEYSAGRMKRAALGGAAFSFGIYLLVSPVRRHFNDLSWS
jgi:hypothetical protein